jgi:hypothetical protein
VKRTAPTIDDVAVAHDLVERIKWQIAAAANEQKKAVLAIRLMRAERKMQRDRRRVPARY